MRNGLLLAVSLLVLHNSGYALENQHIARHTPAIHPKESSILGYFSVPQGSVAVVERLGEFIEIAQPGPHFFTPLMTAYTRIDLKRVFVDIRGIEAKTKDLQTVKIEAAYSYHVTDPYRACYTRENVEQGLQLLFSRSILKEFGLLTADQIISLDRDQLCLNLLTSLNAFVHGKTHKKSDAQQMGESLLEDLEDHHLIGEDLEEGQSSINRADTTPLLSGKKIPDFHGIKSKNHLDQNWGINIDSVAIADIIYPQAIIDGMNARRQAELAQINLKINTEAQKAQTQIQSEAHLIQVENDAKAAKRKMELDAEAEALKRHIDTNVKLETAEAQAKAALIAKKNEAEMSIVETEAKAKGEKIKRELEAEAVARSQQIANKVKLETAEAEANAAVRKAEGETQAMKIKGEMEISLLKLKAEIYQGNPEFTKLEMARLGTDATAKAFSGQNTKVLVVPQSGEAGSSANMLTPLLIAQQMMTNSDNHDKRN
jgi:regulator of protease activity HflC (stomatin/prohibitin superfamily)